MSEEASIPLISGEPQKNALTYLLRGVIAINFVRFALSLWPRFEGTEKNMGFADQLFGSYRLGGFRADFVWLTASTIVIFFLLPFFVVRARKSTSARFDLILSVAWVASFAIYVARALFSGVFYFG
jgi:hypothetical protein